MHDSELYRILLGVEAPWKITGVEMDAKAETITVRVELAPGARLACPDCGKADCTIKDRRERTWRHLDTCQFKTFVVSPLPRTDCASCGVKTVNPPWANGHSRFTLLFERFAIDALLEMNLSAAARLLRITWDEADGIVQRAVQRGLARQDLTKIRRIGIDEKAVLKGHNYITVVCDLDTRKVLWVGRDRTADTLNGFFAGLPRGVAENIECIAMDMWQPFRAACNRWIPGADDKIVLDRFHIDKKLNEAVDTVRKQEHRELKQQGRGDLTGTKYDWLHRPENLAGYRRHHFEAMRQSNLKTARAYALKEQFRRFWYYIYPGNARHFFNDWHSWAVRSRLDPMKKLAKSLHNHLPRIMTYFQFGVTNAIAEGINNKIQTVKKQAYGFRNVERFINKIYFHCAGLKLHPL